MKRLEIMMIDVAVLVINSKICAGEAEDRGKESLCHYLQEHDLRLVGYDIVPDDRETICKHLMSLCEKQDLQVIFTVGGTGVRPTDWAPEATRDVIEKEIPGIGEAMRAESLKKMRTAMLSRGTAGIRGKTMVVNLPGSPKSAIDNLATLLPILDHMVEKISGLPQDKIRKEPG
ncbi:MAG: MogA/MoaB family molybdenum cofactor biosynthesis protein [Nitrospira sp.]|nr:MogA/MoaB family molybdenum cofactor biosynthesis protein [Nitrospira sp.]